MCMSHRKYQWAHIKFYRVMRFSYFFVLISVREHMCNWQLAAPCSVLVNLSVVVLQLEPKHTIITVLIAYYVSLPLLSLTTLNMHPRHIIYNTGTGEFMNCATTLSQTVSGSWCSELAGISPANRLSHLYCKQRKLRRWEAENKATSKFLDQLQPFIYSIVT